MRRQRLGRRFNPVRRRRRTRRPSRPRRILPRPPEPGPDPDGNKLLTSAIIEQDCDSLPGVANITSDFESATSEPPPPPESPATPRADAHGCNQMQHDSQICEDGTPRRPPPRATLLPGAPATLVTRNRGPRQATIFAFFSLRTVFAARSPVQPSPVQLVPICVGGLHLPVRISERRLC
jgi:hypothetical protein